MGRLDRTSLNASRTLQREHSAAHGSTELGTWNTSRRGVRGSVATRPLFHVLSEQIYRPWGVSTERERTRNQHCPEKIGTCSLASRVHAWWRAWRNLRWTSEGWIQNHATKSRIVRIFRSFSQRLPSHIRIQMSAPRVWLTRYVLSCIQNVRLISPSHRAYPHISPRVC